MPTACARPTTAAWVSSSAFSAEAFGREEVVVRLSPASGLLSQIRGNPSADVLIPTSVVRKNSKQTTVIRFGTITVDYK